QRDLVELAVDHVDLAVVEVGGVQVVRGTDVAGGETGVDSPVGRLEADLGLPGDRAVPEGDLLPDLRVPAGDGPGLGGEKEHGRAGIGAVGHREVGRVAGAHDGLVDVEHLAGRRPAWDVHLERLLDRAAVDVSYVQLAQACPGGRHPERPGV